MSSLDIRKTLLPLRRILDSSEFWPPRHELGLALFSHPQFFRGFHLPNEFIEHKLSASTHFDLEPLKRFINSDKQYYVLTLSHKHIQLFQGGRNELKPVKLKGLPTNLWSALNIDEFPNWRETHTIAPASFGKGSEAYHGQYNVKETDKVMLLDFFRRIDKRLRRFLRRKTRPLILGGVDYLIPIYRKANTYPYLLDKTISGNLDEAGPVEIQRSAWTLIEKGETP